MEKGPELQELTPNRRKISFLWLVFFTLLLQRLAEQM